MLETMLVNSCGIEPGFIAKAINGLEAYQMTMHTEYDLILMDLTMNVMNGFESCKLIKKTSKQNDQSSHALDTNLIKSQIPYIVAISASCFDEGLVNQCKKVGFNDWFTAPLSV